MSETRVLLGRVGGGGVPTTAPEVVLQASGAGSNGYNQTRVFSIPLDMDDPTAAVYALRNTVFNKIYYAIDLRLTNVAPGKSKTLLLDIRGLGNSELCGSENPWYPGMGYRDNERHTRVFSKAMGIWEDGVRNTEWRGRDNIWRLASDADGAVAMHKTVNRAFRDWKLSMRNVGPTPRDEVAVRYPEYYPALNRGNHPRAWSTYSGGNAVPRGGTAPNWQQWKVQPGGGRAGPQQTWSGSAGYGSGPGVWQWTDHMIGGAILRRLSLYSDWSFEWHWLERARMDGGMRYPGNWNARTYRFKFEYYGDVEGGRLLTVDSFHPVGYAET